MENNNINPEAARAEFEQMVKAAMVNGRVKLGNVEFWIDSDGPWAGQLSFDKASNLWDVPAIQACLISSMMTA